MSVEQQSLARAESLVALGRWQEAIDVLGPAAAASATASEAHCLRAQCQLGLDAPRRAEKAAKDALAIDPNDEWAHRLLSVAYLRAGRRRSARDEAREALRLNPDSVHGYHVLALALMALNDSSGAKEAAAAAVAASPHDPLSHETLATVRAAGGDWKGAEEAYRDGLRLAPEDADMAIGLAEALRRQGRRDEAADTYLAAARNDPTDHRARRGLARLGLPILGVSWLLVKIGALAGVHALTDISLQPADVAVIFAVVLSLGAASTTAFRIYGTRDLPEAVRRGLRGEHRNAALGWLRAAGAVAVMLGIWSAAASPAHGGGLVAAAIFFAVALAAIVAASHFRVGIRSGWRARLSRLRTGALPRLRLRLPRFRRR